MKPARVLLGAVVVAAFLSLSSCTDRAPTEPPQAPAPDASLIGNLLKPSGLLQCTPLPAQTATKTIGSDGGVLQIGPHYLVVPPGALHADVTITARINSESVDAVQFQPEGLTFDRPAYLNMSYANCNLLGLLLPKRIAYTSDRLQILSFLLSVDNLFTKRVTGRLEHFSQYAVSW